MNGRQKGERSPTGDTIGKKQAQSDGGGRKTRLEERGKGDGVASKQHRRRAEGRSVSREIGERIGEAREERRETADGGRPRLSATGGGGERATG